MTSLEEALRRAGLVRSAVPVFTPLPGGVSSDILLVEDGPSRFVVKRALDRLRVKDAWFADVGRNWVEQCYFSYAGRVVPEAVPRILGGNRDEGWFAMEYLGRGFAPWKTALLQGGADPEAARRAGSILGRIHARSWNDAEARERFDTLGQFRQLRIEPYLVTTAERVPEARDDLLREAARLADARIALVHGDYSPKNLLVGDDRLVVLDAECGWFGDPSFDAAFLLTHLHLKALLRAARPEPLLALAPAFWSAYAGELGPRADFELEARTVRLVLCLMLARVHGKSPVEYLDSDALRKRVTAFAAGHLRRPPAGLPALTRAWRALL